MSFYIQLLGFEIECRPSCVLYVCGGIWARARVCVCVGGAEWERERKEKKKKKNKTKKIKSKSRCNEQRRRLTPHLQTWMPYFACGSARTLLRGHSLVTLFTKPKKKGKYGKERMHIQLHTHTIDKYLCSFLLTKRPSTL